ncbi:uncharacterized protein N7503_007548 [Penicillium pulvis]|uniref:uncharacterized protein n=1 Tax=Penicillium pulvis TaxID=1562058 RepID=UPI0025474094|nr:uncharacterized protein N7503_007548 [Penicillium pulvis]KAJ5798252.1 hypothetical protein N7503_007548 [Penicillium pulvis]
MGFDMTMLAPGPAGTSMIGESNIDAAARRGYARKQREREAQAKLDSNVNPTEKDSDTQSEKTLAAQSNMEDDRKNEDTLSLASTQVGSTKREGGIRGTWDRVKGKFR